MPGAAKTSMKAMKREGRKAKADNAEDGEEYDPIPSIKCQEAFLKWNPKPVAKKVTEFKEQAANAGWDVDKVKKHLRTHFSQAELSQMYGQLARATDNDKSVQDAVKKNTEIKGKHEGKRETLALSILHPDAWKTMLVSKTVELINSNSKSKERRPYTRGELEQIHGVSEATRLIEKGKFTKDEDSDGDSVYIKTVKTETVTKKKNITGAIKGEKHGDAKAMDEMAQALMGRTLDEDFTGLLGADMDFDDKRVKKRPASAIKDKAGATQDEPPAKDPKFVATSKAKQYLTKVNGSITALMSDISAMKGVKGANPMIATSKEVLAELQSMQKALQTLVAFKAVNISEINKKASTAEGLIRNAKDVAKKNKPWK
eukprot:TRINITY_DN45311_c0_g1_i1.p1 TRINITY_DN45311_c0_g1~~TRINITY_DN45311_c0_g1_i1.p1  ORF type:complete len:372 (+),score=86.05 TRINITY_DN45311_c0_g1_i1:70-1185(+)